LYLLITINSALIFLQTKKALVSKNGFLPHN
jgi:hypothetical protein